MPDAAIINSTAAEANNGSVTSAWPFALQGSSPLEDRGPNPPPFHLLQTTYPAAVDDRGPASLARPLPAASRHQKGLLRAGTVTLLLSTLAGGALLLVLVGKEGWSQIAQVVASARWAILGLAAFHLVPLAFDGLSWWILFPKPRRPSLPWLLVVRWLGEAVSNLLPATSLGGDILRARWITGPGTPLALSCSTVVINITIGILSQIAFTLLGMGLLARTHGVSLGTQVAWEVLLGAIALAAFYAIQRLGVFRLLKRLTSRFLKGPGFQAFLTVGEDIESAIAAGYADVSAIMACVCWSTLYWLVGSVEVWIALSAIGARADFTTALIIESVIQGVRTTAFFLPGALGVQEGGYLVVCNLLGMPGDVALGLSLLRRAREIICGIPGILCWQMLEIHRLRIADATDEISRLA